MIKPIFNTLTTIIILLLTLITACTTPKTSTSAPTQPVVEVKRGNLDITVSVDGNLVMPQAFDLRFGTPGNVQDVYVQEGDYVKAGTILARLDNSPQQLDIKSANNSLQQTLSNLYETIPGIQQTFNFPSFYPNASALLAVDWLQQEMSTAYDLYTQGKYDRVVSELSIAISDLEACKQIFQDAISNPQVGFDDKTLALSEDPTFLYTSSYPQEKTYIYFWKNIVQKITQGQDDIRRLQSHIRQGNSAEASLNFKNLLKSIENICILVRDNVNRIEIIQHDMDYPSKNLCLYFYRIAEENLEHAMNLTTEGKINSVEYNEALRTARHCMEICNSILGSNVLVLEHGLSLKNTQQYNIELAKGIVTINNANDNITKTIIVAPFDGTVVKVGFKKNDVLSAMDYSSGASIQLVDTKAIKFQGMVDEIDILKIKTGQKAKLSIDAVPDKTFTGTVTFISPYGSADATSRVVKFSVTIAIDPSDIELKGGLTATADIAIDTIENALLVPLPAITTTPEGSYVTVINQITNQPEKRQVRLGKRNLQYAEVLSGLNEGDKVIIELKAISGAPVITAPPGPPGGGGPPP